MIGVASFWSLRLRADRSGRHAWSLQAFGPVLNAGMISYLLNTSGEVPSSLHRSSSSEGAMAAQELVQQPS